MRNVAISGALGCKYEELSYFCRLLKIWLLFVTGCITADELKFVLTHLPGKVTYKEIDEMIKTVDENGDGKINYQEFRVMIGAKPNLTAAMAEQHPHLAAQKQQQNKKAHPDLA